MSHEPKVVFDLLVTPHAGSKEHIIINLLCATNSPLKVSSEYRLTKWMARRLIHQLERALDILNDYYEEQ